MLVHSFLLALSWPQDEAIFTHAPGRYLDLLLGILISWHRHLQPIGTWQEVSEGELSLGIRHRRQPKLMQCDQCANDRIRWRRVVDDPAADGEKFIRHPLQHASDFSNRGGLKGYWLSRVIELKHFPGAHQRALLAPGLFHSRGFAGHND